MGAGLRRANDLLTLQGQHCTGLFFMEGIQLLKVSVWRIEERELSCEYPCNGPSVHDPMCVEFRVDFGVVSIFTS